MVHPKDCAVIIPCFNESRNIGALVAQVRRHIPWVLVVDDGSKDGTSQIALECGAKVLRHGSNLGKGASLRTGWKAASDNGFHWALSLDGDGQHSPSDIPGFLAQMTSRTALLVGNRMADSRKMPLVRRIANRWMTRRLTKLAGIELLDSQCGFRMVNLKALRNIAIHSLHFEIESELIAAFASKGLGIDFIDIQTIYNDGKSRINPVVDGIRWFKWWMTQPGCTQLASKIIDSEKEASDLSHLITNQ